MEEYLEDTAAYLIPKRKRRILLELYFNAYRTIKSVYLFKHFEEYVHQLQAHENENKKDVYWNASYYEKLIDYVKFLSPLRPIIKPSCLIKAFLFIRLRKI